MEKTSSQLLEQYKIYVSSVEKISDRRENANKYFVTLNSVVILAGTFLIDHVLNKGLLIFLLLGVLFLGVFICIIFYFLINSYKQLNTAKFKLLHEIEKKLPLQLYAREWDILGKGTDKNRYFPFSHIERIIPIAFSFIYTVSIIFLIVWLCFVK